MRFEVRLIAFMLIPQKIRFKDRPGDTYEWHYPISSILTRIRVADFPASALFLDASDQGTGQAPAPHF